MQSTESDQHLKIGHIKMHNLVELWALLTLFLSKIFDQAGGQWSADVGLFNFEELFWPFRTVYFLDILEHRLFFDTLEQIFFFFWPFKTMLFFYLKQLWLLFAISELFWPQGTFWASKNNRIFFEISEVGKFLLFKTHFLAFRNLEYFQTSQAQKIFQDLRT